MKTTILKLTLITTFFVAAGPVGANSQDSNLTDLEIQQRQEDEAQARADREAFEKEIEGKAKLQWYGCTVYKDPNPYVYESEDYTHINVYDPTFDQVMPLPLDNLSVYVGKSLLENKSIDRKHVLFYIKRYYQIFNRDLKEKYDHKYFLFVDSDGKWVGKEGPVLCDQIYGMFALISKISVAKEIHFKKAIKFFMKAVEISEKKARAN